jgi:regulator of protease activity HflC (stomatin/prohibitin superfamily)
VTNLGAVIIAAAMALGGKGDGLQWVWDKVLELWPIGSMDQWQRGIRLRFGKPVRVWGFGEREIMVVQPGAYLKVFGIHRVVEVNVTPRTLTIPPVPITTRDGYPAKLGANVRFSVDDVRKWVLDVHDAKQTLLNDGESVLASFGGSFDWNKQWDIALVNRRLATALRRKVKGYGANILDVELNCFVEVRPYQVFGDASGAPLLNEEE